MTERDVSDLLDAMERMTPEQRAEFSDVFRGMEESQATADCRERFMPFVKRAWPSFIEGRHHRVMADAFERIANGTLKRLIICMPPRHTKSEFSSYLLPAWYLGRYPHSKVIQVSHTAELAVGFGRKVRNLVNTDTYQGVFPELRLAADSKAAGRWNTNEGGEYFAIGVGGSVTGKGADLLIADDVHSEQEAMLAVGHPEVYDRVYEWYMSGPRQRLQPGGAICIVNTRWSSRDLTGRLLRDQDTRGGADRWELIELPAIFPETGNALWPEFWPLEELLRLRATLPAHKWSCQYQQVPASAEASLVKREWWNRWDKQDPPQCDFIIQSWDTAISTSERSNYSACTTWGVFYTVGSDGKELSNIILLDAFQDKLEFPELKQSAFELWTRWKPDSLIVERKNTGEALIQEFRLRGIPVQEYNPYKGTDKVSRVNAVVDLFGTITVERDENDNQDKYVRRGIVWAPNTSWAEEVIEQFHDFPNGENDDLVDSSTAALIRFRKGGFVRLESDEPEKSDSQRIRGRTDYY